MTITKLEYGIKNKVRVYLDEEFAFLLYTSDVKHYSLKEGMEVSQSLMNTILTETVLRRGKQKALAVLNRMDRTEYELRQKLRQGEYPEDIVEQIMEWARSFRYLDDERYAEHYIRAFQEKKSVRQIELELLHKGISKEKIQRIFSRCAADDSLAIEQAIQKKTKNKKVLTSAEKQKLAAFLFRKGFSGDDIRKHLKKWIDEGEFSTE